MANLTQEMDVAPTLKVGQAVAFEKSVSLASATNSPAILVPPGIRGCTVTLSVSAGGTGYVETSTDTVSVVKDGTPVWIKWTADSVSADTSDSAFPVTAIRLVQDSGSGTTQLTIRAQ